MLYSSTGGGDMMDRAMVLKGAGAVLLLLGLAWFFRYDLHAVGFQGGLRSHMLDRWTGKVWLITGATIKPTKHYEPPMSADEFLNRP